MPGFVSLVLGIVSLVLGFVFWVLGFVFWVLGFVFWVLGFVFWVLGFVFWVLGGSGEGRRAPKVLKDYSRRTRRGLPGDPHRTHSEFTEK